MKKMFATLLPILALTAAPCLAAPSILYYVEVTLTRTSSDAFPQANTLRLYN